MIRGLAIVIIFFAKVGPSIAQDWPETKQYTGEYIRHLDLVVDEGHDGSIVIVKIGRWSPFRRYPWFRAGDTIDEVENQKASILVLRSLTANQDAWITFTRGEDSKKVQINLALNFFGLSPWAKSSKWPDIARP